MPLASILHMLGGLWRLLTADVPWVQWKSWLPYSYFLHFLYHGMLQQNARLYLLKERKDYCE
jgi:hypothetical protein